MKRLVVGGAAAAALTLAPMAVTGSVAFTGAPTAAPTHVVFKDDPGGGGCDPNGNCGSGGQNQGPGGGPGGQGCIPGVGCGSGGQNAGPGGIPGGQGCLPGVGCGSGHA
ncbi:PE-PGRS family protein [Mycobacterium sp. 050134]|uniref:PE-PGRS family protein n=1 Tax=Mycobacterium sp. 050134 TaxID=3096111 RepID=UPI002ED88199